MFSGKVLQSLHHAPGLLQYRGASGRLDALVNQSPKCERPLTMESLASKGAATAETQKHFAGQASWTSRTADASASFHEAKNWSTGRRVSTTASFGPMAARTSRITSPFCSLTPLILPKSPSVVRTSPANSNHCARKRARTPKT